MASVRSSYQNVAIKYGILVGIAHILYFLLMTLLGLHDNVGLSFLSGVLLVIGIIVAISKFKQIRNGSIRYFDGLMIGATVGVVSSTILALFLMLYLNMFDSAYLSQLQASSLFPKNVTFLTLFILTIVYGTIPGFIIAFIAMQWFKREDHSMAERV